MMLDAPVPDAPPNALKIVCFKIISPIFRRKSDAKDLNACHALVNALVKLLPPAMPLANAAPVPSAFMADCLNAQTSAKSCR
jgi:hypothetical protein